MGVVRALRLGLWLAAPMAVSIPACSLFGGAPAPTQAALFASMGFKAVAGTSAFTACLILVNAAAPPGALGQVNGFGQMVAAAVRGGGTLVLLGGCCQLLDTQLPDHSTAANRPVHAPARCAGPALGGLIWAWSLSLPPWIPSQYVPFCLMGLLALATDLVYHGLEMPEAHGSGSSGGGGGSGTGGGGDDPK